MSSELGNVTNATIRDCLGTRSLTAGGLAIDGTNAQNVETTAAVVHMINGVFQTDLAITAEIDLSAEPVLSGKDGTTVAATKIWPALAAGDADQTLVYILACKGDNIYVIEQAVDVAAAQDDADYELSCPSGYAPFGAIKIVRDETDTSTFQLGSDTAAVGDLDATGRTTTFFDISVCPPTVASIATV
jgi:hypothetical protein